MCEYCVKNFHNLLELNQKDSYARVSSGYSPIAKVWYIDLNLRASEENLFIAMPINFCPICGRKLEEDVQVLRR